MAAEIETLSSQIVYQNKWMTVREDQVAFANGHRGIYGYIDKPDFALIVPIHGDGSIQMVEQYRYPVGQRLWELPLGVWDENPNAEPVDMAHAELLEETGLRAASMESFGDFFQASGLATQRCHMFVARELSAGPAQPEVEEQGMVSRAFRFSEVQNLIRQGGIRDVTTVAALGYLRLLGVL